MPSLIDELFALPQQPSTRPQAADLPAQAPSFWSKLAQTWPARLAKDAYAAATLPGDVYQGAVSMYGADGRTNPEVINRAADLAGLAMTGTGFTAPAGALGAGPAWIGLANSPEIVRQAAIRVGNDTFEAPFHWEAMAKAAQKRGTTTERLLEDLGDYDAFYAPNSPNYGFTTSSGRFVSREEADKLTSTLTEQQLMDAEQWRKTLSR